MNYSITLQQLRKYRACKSGYNKLVASLTGVDYDDNQDGYLDGYPLDKPIPLSYALTSNGISDTLWATRCLGADERIEIVKFAIWCARRVEHLDNTGAATMALDVADKYLAGQATRQEMLDAARYAHNADNIAAAAAYAAADAAATAADYAADYAAYAAADAADAYDAERKAQYYRLMEILSNGAK